MEIGKRYNIQHDLGGGGWDRDGRLSWDRDINGKPFHFSVRWAPDSRASGGLEYMWGWSIAAYTRVGPQKSSYFPTYHSWAWQDYPTGGSDKKKPVDRLKLPRKWYLGIIDKNHLDQKLAEINDEINVLTTRAERLRAAFYDE